MIRNTLTQNFSIMKTLKELKGVKQLGKKEQQAINGGKMACKVLSNGEEYCPYPYVCINGICELGPEL